MSWQTPLLYLLGVLPTPLLYHAANLLYRVLYFVTGYRKAVVMENLARAFPQRNEKEITILAKKFYRQLSQTALEIPRGRTMSEQDLRDGVHLENPEMVEQYSRGYTQSVLLLSLHQGNWEWLLTGTALGLGQPLDVIYKPLHNVATDRFMQQVRGRFGCRTVAVADIAADLLRHRRAPRLLAIAGDQAPGSQERSLLCNFLQQPTLFHHTPGELAARTGLPVLFAHCRRCSPGQYSVRFEALTSAQGEQDAELITRAYAEVAERAILEEPESWLWSHRRWKDRPISTV
ncbi:MAG: KDO2-lipid IV(A) lauroyltransferase [Bacteroidia bacterium]|jgi:KDO2-lipid IV(A) lauroyltransferase